jgi:arsenite methyltransferase
MRVQLALNVKNLDEAVAFYSKLFDAKVNKRKPGYANFAIDRPPLKLVLFENPEAAERLNHLGVEVFDDAEVHAATDRLKAAGMADAVEDQQTCCYATQNKVWARDPEGTRWEWYRVIEDSESFGPESAGAPSRTRSASGGSDATAARRPQDADAIRGLVQEGYTRVVQELGASDADRAEAVGRRIGYSDEQLAAVPDGANLGVGCGNPTAIDALRPGETVVDLGSGAGMDAFLAAHQVGPSGRVIGVDMTDAMLARARENARKTGVTNVEFRKGQIEDLPIEDESVDAIISNCVINLSPEKDRVYREAYRVLRPGGRVMISDIVLERPLPQVVIDSIDAYLGCVGGASLRSEYLETIAKAGFREVRVQREARFTDAIALDDPRVQEAMERLGISEAEAKGYADAITSVSIFAVK